MHIREYKSSDLDALRRMHAAQGFSYPLPDLESPLFLSKLVLEDNGEEIGLGREVAHRKSLPVSSSRVTMAILQRLTAETYLLHDPAAGTPRRRWKCFLALHEAARDAAIERGEYEAARVFYDDAREDRRKADEMSRMLLESQKPTQ